MPFLGAETALPVLVGTFQPWAAGHALSAPALYWPDGAKTRLVVQRTIKTAQKRYKFGTGTLFVAGSGVAGTTAKAWVLG
jgi:hypothetical protein